MANRHSDGGHGPEDPLHIKIALYLDTLTADTGALRLIPGSHMLGDHFATQLSQVVARPRDKVGLPSGAEIPAIACETTKLGGDVVVFNHNIKHSAWGGVRAAYAT